MAFTTSFTQPHMAFWLTLCCLLLILFLTAWDGGADGLQGCQRPGSGNCCETQGRAAATQGAKSYQIKPLPACFLEGAKPALPLAAGQGISATSAAHPWGAFGQGICAVCGASSQSSQLANVLKKH